MKKNLLVILLLSLITGYSSAQLPGTVRYDMVLNSSTDEIEIYAIPNFSVPAMFASQGNFLTLNLPTGAASNIGIQSQGLAGLWSQSGSISNNGSRDFIGFRQDNLSPIIQVNAGIPYLLFTISYDCGGLNGDIVLYTNDGTAPNDGRNWNNLYNVIIQGTGSGDVYAGNATGSVSCPILIPTPVDLLSFDAYPQGKKAKLEWATANELNNSGFEVQRSTDGKEWEVIGWVDGHSNSAVEREYTMVDKAPFMGTNYYRLKQVDFDGTFEYSDVRSATFSFTSEVATIYPNPAMDYMNISFPADLRGELHMEVLDANRTIVFEEVIDVTRGMVKTFDTNDLPSGMYTLKLFSRGYEEYLPFIIARP